MWTTVWPLWEEYEEHRHPYEEDPNCAVPLLWLRHDRSLGLVRGAACVYFNEAEVKVRGARATPATVACPRQLSAPHDALWSLFARSPTQGHLPSRSKV